MRKVPVFRSLVHFFAFQFQPGSFAYPVFLDPQNFDLAHYDFEFTGREFLGQVRCLVFDVTPRPRDTKNLFKGRIWVEDQGYHIVRFNGRYGPNSSFPFHFDTWRENLQPGIWLPVYVYTEERELSSHGLPHLGFRSQTRLWGYDLRMTTGNQALTQILVDSKTPIEDASTVSHDVSPLESARGGSRRKTIH
jgi:hypothetical protein